MSLPNYENIELDINAKLSKLLPTFLKGINTHYKESPVKSKRIEDALMITGAEVRAIVRHCRRKLGIPIGSDGTGYYLCRNRFELELTKEHLHGRIKSIQKTLLELDSVKFKDDIDQLLTLM